MRKLVALVLVLSLPMAGCIRDFEEHQPENHLRLRGIDVAAPLVTSGSVTLAVNITFDNFQAASDPVRLVVKAFDADTGFRVATETARLDEVPEDKTVPVEVMVKVARKAGYRIQVDIYEDGFVVQQGEVTVRNVGALEPTLHETGLSIGTMDFLVRNVTGNRVAIETKVYLTNEADTTARTLDMQVKARDMATGLLADEARTQVSGIGPEETHAFAVTLTVPDRRNYAVEAVLWDGNLTVERGKGTVQLLPTITKDKDEEIIVSEPRIEDFVRDGRDAARGAAQGDRGSGFAEDTASETPGPGLVLAGLAVVAAALVAGRRRWT